ncbi:MAG: porin [Nitrospinae bacterium]|nr:porin [Nitrospinota bacterium]
MKRSFFIALVFTAALFRSQAMAEEADGGFKVSGFVDASYYTQDRSEASTFSLDETEVDIEKTIKDAGGLRLDINYRTVDRMVSVSAKEGETISIGGLSDVTLEQGYVWADLPGGLKFTFGKFNAPIGFELVDPTQMFQFSHAMVFIYGLPTNLTGAMLSGAFGIADFSVYGVNGWDRIQDDNKDKTIGGRLGVTPVEGVNVGLSYITGKEGSDEAGAQTSALGVYDVDMTIKAIAGLTLGAEFNSGKYEGKSAVNSGSDAEWTGYMIVGNYAFTDKIALTLRYDSFDDKDGARLGSGLKEKRDSFTVSPSYAIAKGFNALLEYRQTKSDQKVFMDRGGKASDTVTEAALEFTYSF